MSAVNESDLEAAVLAWFAQLGYEVLDREALDPEGVHQERSGLDQVVLAGRLEAALYRLNADAPIEAIQEALRRILRRDAPTLVQNNREFHRILVDGLQIEVAGENGGVSGVHIRVFDFDAPDENDWLAVNQVSFVDRASGTGQERIPDVVVFVNGLPVAVIELKNPADQDADIWDAYNQLETYKHDIPSLFVFNCVLVISDDVHARIGSLTANDSRFAPWRTVTGEGDEPATAQPLKVLIAGVFEKGRFLDLVQNFVTFEHDRGKVVKKIAGYHQVHAVRKAVNETARAAAASGDRRVGVVWHTQGSGKSLSMVFYARKLILAPAMENPTIVVLTDRNDLDDQLFGTFSQSQALLRQEPIQARDRVHLRELLQTASGGVYFTTVQKFLPDEGERQPALSDRRNIVVIADEAHRSQYGFKGRLDTRSGQMVYGFAKHMRDALPNASFIGFTGTPIELDDKNTIQVFGDYISIYDIHRAVEDQAIVPIYYENRLAKLDLDENEKPNIDPQFEEVTEGEEETRKESLKSEWSTVEALVGTGKRLELVAADIVQHFEKRLGTLEGKALIVCMSRRICVDLYDQIVKLRPQWHDADDDAGAIKVVMTGSAADVEKLRPHVRSKGRRERMADRFKDPADPLKIVIVRDMWLTGFDAPCMHTLYVDKPMRGHNLMQAIARVNRVFGDKPGGLVVDYIGIATLLREAMLTYTRSGGTGDATNRQEKAVEVMIEKLEVCRDVFHGFDYTSFFSGKPKDRLELLPAAREHVLGQRRIVAEGAEKPKDPPDGYDVFIQAVGDLSSAFTLATPHDQCEAVRDEVAFFQAVKVGLIKLVVGRRPPSADLGHAIRQIVANAIVTDEVIDVFDAAGLPKPDISILSPEFLAEVQGMKYKNLAAALLKRLLEDEVRARARRNVVQARRFSELLENAIKRYQNRTIESAQVIEELIDIARQFRDADRKGEELALSRDEAAFYEALADNESAQKVMGDSQLVDIARELTRLVRENATVDWNHKRSVQAKLRVMVKRLLKKSGYPPDAQQKATELVLEQAKALGINVTEGASESSGEPRIATDYKEAAERPKDLPYPIAVFDSLVESQENAVLRVKTRRDGFEKALVFVVGVEIGLVRQANQGKAPEAMMTLLKEVFGRPVSMGTWLELAWKFAAMLPANTSDVMIHAVRSLVTIDGKPSDLTKELQQTVVPERNLFAHGVSATEESVAKAEGPLHSLWQRFKKALAPLADARLVARAELVDHDDDKGSTYKVRLLQGSSDHFPVREETVHGKLVDDWCYLLREGLPPLLLAPVVSCRYSDESDRREVFLARTLAAPGEKAEAMGVASTTKTKVIVPK